jgi:hypothetical protein
LLAIIVHIRGMYLSSCTTGRLDGAALGTGEQLLRCLRAH